MKFLTGADQEPSEHSERNYMAAVHNREGKTGQILTEPNLHCNSNKNTEFQRGGSASITWTCSVVYNQF